jgi:hypothetical protein
MAVDADIDARLHPYDQAAEDNGTGERQFR